MRWWELMQMLSLHEREPEADEPPEGDGADPIEPDDPGAGGGSPFDDIVPEHLRGRSKEEIKAAINKAFQRESKSEEEMRQLRKDLEDLKTRSSTPPEPKGPEKPLDELLYENPEEAIASVIEKRFGRRFLDMEDRVGSTVMATMRSQLPDFDEYEDDVKELLNQSRAPHTQENILGAYKMVLGDRAMSERLQSSRRTSNPERPPPDRPKPPKPSYTTLEADIAKGMGMSIEEYVAERDKEDFDIKVPT